MKKPFCNGEVLRGLSKMWLIGVLLFLPFQYRLVEIIEMWNNEAAKFIRLIDEITIGVFLPFAIVHFFKQGSFYRQLYLGLMLSIAVFYIAGLFSGSLNGNSLETTAIGSLFYIKYFLPLFIYAFFFRNSNDVKTIVRLLLMLGVVLGVVALIQEGWQLSARYLLDRNIADSGWREGLFRAASLMGHYNNYGMYALLLTSIYLSTVREIKNAFFATLISGVFLSLSRTIYLGFLFVAGIQIIKGKRWLVIVTIPFLLLLYKFSALPDLNIQKHYIAQENGMEIKDISDNATGNPSYIREIGREKAIEVWMDHPVWGVGPGMFGSPLAIKNNSYVHDDYNFSARLVSSHASGSIDQYWFQILAETGIAGLGMYAGILITFLTVLALLRKQEKSFEITGLINGLMAYMIVLVIYGFGANLNMVELTFTYSALIGLAIGCSTRSGNEITEAS